MAVAGFKPGEMPYPQGVVEGDDQDAVMVVDPNALDYDSEYETDTNEHVSDNENGDLNELYRNVFMCKYCDQAFSERADCSAHELANHNNNVPYRCSLCEMSFADRLQYSAHLKSIHQNDKPYNCPECDRTFARRSDLRKHTVVHTGIKPFTCNVCYKSFSRNTNLSKHMRIHSGQKPFVCPKCPKTFISKGDLTRHMVIHTGHKPFACNYCPLSFGRRDKLVRHEKRHFPRSNQEDKSQDLQAMRDNIYDYGLNNGNNNESADANPEGRPDCNSSENIVINLDPFNHNNYGNASDAQGDGIDYGMLNGDSLPRVPDHITGNSLGNEFLEEERELPYIPEHITGDSFSMAAEAMKYSKKSSGEVRHFPCNLCPKRFSNLEALHIHLSMHSGSRPHQCHVCSKAFFRKRELDRHIATHTGMKPFKCMNCDKRFGRKDKLIRHMRIHDANRDHNCTICGATFNRKDALNQHMKSHAYEEKEPDSVVTN